MLDDIAKWRKTNPGQADRAEKDLQQALLDWNAVTERIAVKISTVIPAVPTSTRGLTALTRDWLVTTVSKPDADGLAARENLDQPLPDTHVVPAIQAHRR